MRFSNTIRLCVGSTDRHRSNIEIQPGGNAVPTPCIRVGGVATILRRDLNYDMDSER